MFQPRAILPAIEGAANRGSGRTVGAGTLVAALIVLLGSDNLLVFRFLGISGPLVFAAGALLLAGL